MVKKDLIRIIDDLLVPNSFKRNGHKWSSENNVFLKVVILQKSKYSNSYYLNYGFIIKTLDLNDLEMHIYNRLGSVDDTENRRIMESLDLDSTISIEQRVERLATFISKYILSILLVINTEDELRIALQKRPHLNDIPLIVKHHLQLKF